MTILIFPGQGSQKPGMGKDFFAHSSAARAIFDRAAPLLPSGFLDTVFHGDQETLNQTRIAQPALLVVETAIASHLKSAGFVFRTCAGHSLGEIPALVAASACAFEDAVGFTLERARLMSENVPEGGMAAVIGMDPEQIAALLPEGVQVANYNGPAQTIISGASRALETAAKTLKEAGAKRVLPLKVSGPFHSEFMRPAAEQFRRILQSVPFRKPRVSFVSSVTGDFVEDPEQIRHLLAEQLVRPVRWLQTMLRIGAGAALEVGPGNVLQGLAKRIEGAPEVRGAGALEDLAGLNPA